MTRSGSTSSGPSDALCLPELLSRFAHEFTFRRSCSCMKQSSIKEKRELSQYSDHSLTYLGSHGGNSLYGLELPGHFNGRKSECIAPDTPHASSAHVRHHQRQLGGGQHPRSERWCSAPLCGSDVARVARCLPQECGIDTVSQHRAESLLSLRMCDSGIYISG